MFSVSFTGPRDSCGGQLTARSTPDWITSPRYPDNYPENIVCDWIITAENPSDIITLQVLLLFSNYLNCSYKISIEFLLHFNYENVYHKIIGMNILFKI